MCPSQRLGGALPPDWSPRFPLIPSLRLLCPSWLLVSSLEPPAPQGQYCDLGQCYFWGHTVSPLSAVPTSPRGCRGHQDPQLTQLVILNIAKSSPCVPGPRKEPHKKAGTTPLGVKLPCRLQPQFCTDTQDGHSLLADPRTANLTPAWMAWCGRGPVLCNLCQGQGMGAVSPVRPEKPYTATLHSILSRILLHPSCGYPAFLLRVLKGTGVTLLTPISVCQSP